MRVNGFTDIDCICAHFDGEADFGDQVARACADDAAADDATCVGVKYEFGESFVAAVGDGST